jgi:hypothetical protein
MRRLGHKAADTPWLIIATVTGITVVIVMALLFFSGYIVVPAESTPMVPVPIKTAGSTLKPTLVAVTTTRSGTSPTPTPVVLAMTDVPVSSDGLYIKVDYIGTFSGTYAVNGVQQVVRSSGTRLYSLPDATGTVSASFQKEDGTTKHALTVGIYKDGKLLRSGEISTAYGKVNITTDV